METLMQGRTGLWYAWNGAHTVNVRHEVDGPDVDCYSIGSFALDAATHAEFVESVEEMDPQYDAGVR